MLQFLGFTHRQLGCDKNVIDIVLRAPARECMQILYRLMQSCKPDQMLHLFTIVTAIHITHDNRMRKAVDDIRQIIHLHQSRPATERKMHDDHGQCISSRIVSGKNSLSTGNQTRKTKIPDFGGMKVAEQTVAVLGKAPKAPIDLMMPVREIAPFRKIFGQIDEVAAQTASIHFLYTDDIKIFHYLRGKIQVTQTLGAWQDMPPASRQVLMRATGFDPDLDVVTENSQYLRLRPGFNL